MTPWTRGARTAPPPSATQVSGGDYGDVSAGSVSVTVTDDDTAGITVTAAEQPSSWAKGASATYTVKLNTQPSGDVVHQR